MRFPDRVYEVLKWLCLIVLPAVSTLYWTLAGIWEWPYAEQVSGTIGAVCFFIGSLIGISTKTYRKENGYEN